MKPIKLIIEHKFSVTDEELEELMYLIKKNNNGDLKLVKYLEVEDDDSCYVYFPINGEYLDGSLYLDLMEDRYPTLLALQVKDEWSNLWSKDD